MDAATLEACTNAKAAGVQIYTVGFSIPSDPIDTRWAVAAAELRNQNIDGLCRAGRQSLVSTFQSIAQQMSGLRLTN